MTPLQFAPMTAAHWPDVARIYTEGIATGHGTFESTPPASWEEFSKSKLLAGCFVAFASDGTLIGWAALSPISARAVYRGVAEASVYIAASCRGRGVGSALTAELIHVAEANGIWTLQSATFPENTASLALQQKHGFRIVGRRERIGRMSHGPLAGRWRDTILLERRSPNVGVD